MSSVTFRSEATKLGSFVYNVNKAIYNMLFENKRLWQFPLKNGEATGWHFCVGHHSAHHQGHSVDLTGYVFVHQ